MRNRKPRNILKHRAIENLQLLNKKELKIFSKWLNSTWSNSIGNLAKLFNILKPHYPEFTHPKLTKKHLYNRLYPEKDYHDKDYLNLMSKLSLAVEDFLIHSHIRENKEIQAELRLKVINERSLDRSRKEKLLDHAIKVISKKSIKSTTDYLRLTQLHGLHLKLSPLHRSQDEKRTDIISIDKNLDSFYALSKTRNLMEMKELKKLLREKTKISSDDKKILQLGKKIPAVQFYKGCLEQNSKPEKEHFTFLQKIFLDHIDEINKVDQHNIYLILINQSARIKSAGDNEILKETQLLNKLAFSKGIILDNNQITAQSFTNLITTACFMQDFEFAQVCLKHYLPYLPHTIQEDALQWGTLIINYKQETGNVVKLANRLNDHTRAYTTFSLRIRVLITQVLFDAYNRDENDMDDKFIYYIEAFEKKLERESNYPEKQLIGLKAFNKYTKKLASFFRGNNFQAIELESIKSQINQESIIHAKSWLIDKIEQMK